MPKWKTDKATFKNKLWIERCDVGFGLWQYTAFHREWSSPVGIVWVLPIGGKCPMAHVMHSYVRSEVRRLGIRSAINDEIFKLFNCIQSWEGTKQGGEAFMKATGYTHDRMRGDWFKKKPVNKSARKAR